MTEVGVAVKSNDDEQLFRRYSIVAERQLVPSAQSVWLCFGEWRFQLKREANANSYSNLYWPTLECVNCWPSAASGASSPYHYAQVAILCEGHAPHVVVQKFRTGTEVRDKNPSTLTIPKVYSALIRILRRVDESQMRLFKTPDNSPNIVVFSIAAAADDAAKFYIRKEIVMAASVELATIVTRSAGPHFRSSPSEGADTPPQIVIAINDDGAEPSLLSPHHHHFHDFLLALAHEQPRPAVTPTNVRALLALAHLYQVGWLVDECERHLLTCFELTHIDRLLLADTYALKQLEMQILVAIKENASDRAAIRKRLGEFSGECIQKLCELIL